MMHPAEMIVYRPILIEVIGDAEANLLTWSVVPGVDVRCKSPLKTTSAWMTVLPLS